MQSPLITCFLDMATRGLAASKKRSGRYASSTAAAANPGADEQTAAAHPEVADTRIAPYCLIVRARKP
jgi:hypothetical protein